MILPVISIIFFAVALLGVAYIAIIYCGRMRRVRKRMAQCAAAEDDVVVLPKASVIVYTRDDDTALAENLPLILEQQYRGQFEVIVVNDGVPDNTDMIVTRLKARYPNLYLTFAPDSSRNVSRKKLAITLGVKAAKGTVVVVTDANTHVPGDKWLESMVMPFVDESVEVVLGYNALLLPEGRWTARLLTIFDYTADSVAWLSAAIKGKPYRGCGTNMAYRKDTFFNNKGFSTSLNLRDGYDDLFVNEIATRDNTVVQLSPYAIGVSGLAHGARKAYRRSRRSHAFTGRKLPKLSRGLMAAGEWIMWLVVLCSLAGAFFAGITNVVGWAVAAVLLITMLVFVIVEWRKTVRCLGGPAMMLTLPWLAAFRPFRNIINNMSCGSRHNANFTWQ